MQEIEALLKIEPTTKITSRKIAMAARRYPHLAPHLSKKGLNSACIIVGTTLKFEGWQDINDSLSESHPAIWERPSVWKVFI